MLRSELIRRHAARVERRRRLERDDAEHYLVVGHDAHVDRCIFDEPCSRDYDPMPYPEAAPTPEKDYVGTGIGALYGLGMGNSSTFTPNEGEESLAGAGDCIRSFATELAGWNVRGLC